MSVRRKIGLILASCAALTAAAAGTGRPSRGAQPPDGRPAQASGSDWSLQVAPSGSITVLHKGTAVITGSFAAWGGPAATARPTLKYEPDGRGRWAVRGEIPAFKAKVTGRLDASAPNALRMELLIRGDQPPPKGAGGGFRWVFQLHSPTFAARPAPPELLPGDAGWTWRLGGGQTIALRFDPPAPRAEFEGGQKNSIRTPLVADRPDPGLRRIRASLGLPEGARLEPSPEERYAPVDLRRWFPEALDPDDSPVDLSFLNRDDRPAGRRGFVRADGDRMVFADGSPARFWGTNVVASALFSTPRERVARQAHRLAQLGFNLVRIHHHDSDWVVPNLFGNRSPTTRRLDPKSLDHLDWWIKCFEDEGIYVWLDVQVGRLLKQADGLTDGAAEVARARGSVQGFCYYNTQIQELMKEFQHEYLGHRNPYTGRAYKDDPAVIGVLITNENDLTHHFGHKMLPVNKNPAHSARWEKGYKEFARANGLPPERVWQTWVPGPAKLYLSQAEHEFNESMIANLRGIGVKAPIATTSFWGPEPLYSLPVLTDGDWIDVHSYGEAEELERNPRYGGDLLTYIAMAQVSGRPLSITEWNVAYPAVDRFTSPLAVASVACLQGWDAPMLFAYAMTKFPPNQAPGPFSAYCDPAMMAVMPAAALLYRREHVSPARKTYYFGPDASVIFGREITPDTSATMRTLAEQSKLTIGIPQTPELPWLKPTRPPADAIVITDPDRDFIPPDQSFVRSDTGELTRDWGQGIRTIDTPRTQAVSGWIGGKELQTRDAAFAARTNKAVIALSSVDDRPLSESRFILVTAIARAQASPGERAPSLSEPVRARITLRTKAADLELLALGKDGRVAARPPFDRQGEALTFEIPTQGGTHWYVLKARGAPAGANPTTSSGSPAPRGGR